MASMITEKTVQNIIGRRNKEIHKGDCGRIMIAAGSEGMAGGGGGPGPYGGSVSVGANMVRPSVQHLPF